SALVGLHVLDATVGDEPMELHTANHDAVAADHEAPTDHPRDVEPADEERDDGRRPRRETAICPEECQNNDGYPKPDAQLHEQVRWVERDDAAFELGRAR